MLRTELFALAETAGWQRGTRMTSAVRTAVRAALRAYFRTPEGRAQLADAPRVHLADRGEDKFQRMTQKDAVDRLMEELDGP